MKIEKIKIPAVTKIVEVEPERNDVKITLSEESFNDLITALGYARHHLAGDSRTCREAGLIGLSGLEISVIDKLLTLG